MHVKRPLQSPCAERACARKTRHRLCKSLLLLSLEFGSTPSSASSSFTTASCPFIAVRVNTVLREQQPTSSCPFYAAHNSGIRLLLSSEFGSTPSFASISFTTASYPFIAPHNSGVALYLHHPSRAAASLPHRARPPLPAIAASDRPCL